MEQPCPPGAETVVVENPLGGALELCGEAARTLDSALAAHGLSPDGAWYMITFFDAGADGSAWDPTYRLPVIGVRAHTRPGRGSSFLVSPARDSLYRAYYAEDLRRTWIAKDCGYEPGERVYPYPTVTEGLVVAADRQRVLPWDHWSPSPPQSP